MSAVGLVVHPRRAAAAQAAELVERQLDDADVTTTRLADEAPFGEPGSVDLVVSIGGDGTFLRAAQAASELDSPVLGVKVGRLGFLTEVEPEDAFELISAVLAGRARIEERLALTAEAIGGVSFPPQWGLNEVMVEKRARHRLIRLAVDVDGGYVTTFSADGVIVATPTGSTAYSFSARGPIVAPGVACLVLTPIAPHMVFDRSFVLAPGSVARLTVEGEESGILSADGRRSIELPVGASVQIRASSRPARLVRRADAPAFLALVRGKFGLPGADREAGPGGVGTGS